jgi:N-acyl-D-amino-acid deacylase
MYDILIRNGKIVDGTGNPWFRADIAIRDGKIAAIGQIPADVVARQVMDAAGLVVAPGFIDIHSHSDLPLLVDGLAQGKVRQGVTTEVIGNCGFSLAPIMSDMAKADVYGDLESYGLPHRWESMDEYLTIMQQSGISIHVVPLIGHGAIRKSVMNYDQRQATPEELEVMRQLIRDCMEAGCFGMTTGLIYAPSCYGDTDELVELAKVVAEYGGIYATHMRNESSELFQAVEESIEIGRRAGLPVQISHHKVCHPDYWGEVERTLQLMHQVRDGEGLDVTCDVYPYLATATSLTSLIPDEYHAGGKEVLLSHLHDAALRVTLLDHLETYQGPRGWHNLFISDVKTDANRSVEGKDIATIAQERGICPAQVIMDLLIEEELSVGMIRFAMCEADVASVIRDDLTMIGSDGDALAIAGPLSKGKPHPRNFGTFPRVLGKYCREEGVISLEKAVQKMTSLSAGRLGLMSKGILREGLDADLTMFDPATVKDLADFANPFQYPTGIPHVMVGGTWVIMNGEHTGAKSGQVLRKYCR